ncbi:MAG TPA: hypothetical protein VNI01_06520, partial [Elusimicrobiota bacterium]|nr:hypothetical protein [Elusimicrobiota bacterium]
MIFKKWLARLLAAALTLGCLPEARAAGRIVPSGNSGALNGGALGGSAADAARSIGGVPSVQVPLADLGAAELGGLPASVPLADAAIAA